MNKQCHSYQPIKKSPVISTAYTLPSNECSTSPKPSESSIIDSRAPALSGLSISFGKTLQWLAHKTVTRRSWKDSHAQKFVKAFHQNKLIKALDKDIRYGGKQIGWCRLLCAPYKEQLAAMPKADLAAEGGMCDSLEQFIQRYFKGNTNIEVWVIRFKFVELNQVASTNTPPLLSVYSDSTIEFNSNYAITSSDTSIHQAQLFGFSLCDGSPSSFNGTQTKNQRGSGYNPL